MAKKKKAKAKKKTTRKPAKKARKGKKAASEMLLVASKTKEVLKGYGLNVAGDALDGLNAQVHWLIDQAAKRTEANGRKTVRPHDFVAG